MLIKSIIYVFEGIVNLLGNPVLKQPDKHRRLGRNSPHRHNLHPIPKRSHNKILNPQSKRILPRPLSKNPKRHLLHHINRAQEYPQCLNHHRRAAVGFEEYFEMAEKT